MDNSVTESAHGVRWSGWLVAAVVVAVYSNSFAGVFLMDDGIRILENPALNSLFTAICGTTRPLVGLTLWFNRALGGHLADFHLFNLVVHVTATLLLFGVVRRTCRLGGVSVAQSYVIAAVGSAGWGVHPILTQSVTYIIQRAESMMGMFLLLTLYCFVRAVPSSSQKRWLAASVFACALGMLSKPVMVVAPLMVLLFDWQFCCVQYPFRRWRYYAALLATAGISIALMLFPNESSSTVGVGVGLLSPWRYLLTQSAVIIHYLWLLVWPRDLCFDYAWPSAPRLLSVWWQALLLIALIVLAFVGTRKRNLAAFGLATFFLLLLPTSSIIPVADAAVEHRLYLPLVGMIVCTGTLLYRLMSPLRRGIALYAMIAVVTVVALGARTYDRNADYHRVERMARDTVRLRPDNFRARSALVLALLDAQQYEAGELEARELVARLERGMTLGGVYAETGGMNAYGYYPVGLTQLGRSLLFLGKPVDALVAFNRALDVRPEHKEAWLGKALALHESGRSAQALDAIADALKLDPRYAAALGARKAILRESKHAE